MVSSFKWATNYLGHFALTGRLLPLLRAADAGRVVTMSSLTARVGRIDFNDVQSVRYKPYRAHSMSKLAELIFALELDRRSGRGRWNVLSNAAHPGGVVTNLLVTGPSHGGASPDLLARLSSLLYRVPGLGNTVEKGIQPALVAATHEDASGGMYYGPDGFSELAGAPKRAKVPSQARDEGTAARLWEVSEELTGVTYPSGPVGD